MKHYADKRARIAALNKEMDAIHFSNSLYWQRRSEAVGNSLPDFEGWERSCT
jgi:hypothetical protein